jgi:Skp family chaperone for outer membrane proteins
MARRLFSSFSIEQLSELPRLTVSWPAALSIAGGATALGWTGTTIITQAQKVDAERKMDKRFNDMDKRFNDMDKRFNNLEHKLDAYKLDADSKADKRFNDLEHMLK